jgi:hypothetical protein
VHDVKTDLQGMVVNLQWSLDEIEGELARLARLAGRKAKHPARTDWM